MLPLSRSLLRHPPLLLALVALLALGGCADDRGGTSGSTVTLLAPVADAEGVMSRELVADVLAGAATSSLTLDSFTRDEISPGIALYRIQVRIGSGPHDVIGVDRVVREDEPFRPIRTRTNAFLFHGDLKDFVGCFLPGFLSPTQDDDRGLAYHLAENGVDVWGIDAGWTLVPAGTTDLSFMADWGIDRLTDELEIAVDVARRVRQVSGNGLNRMILAGFSGGAPIILELASREADRPSHERRVAGLIPIEQGAKSDDPAWNEVMCQEYATYAGLLDSGVAALDNPFPVFGGLATSDPEGASPLVEGLTNWQAGLALGAFPFFPQLSSVFVSGLFDENGLPTGLRFTDADRWIDFIRDAPAYFPVKLWADAYQEMCPDVADGPWFANLDRITVPTLYVTAGQGFGGLMDLTVDEMSAASVTRLDVSVTGDPNSDIAHVDLVLGNDAESLLYEPVLEWIRQNTERAPRSTHRGVDATP